MTKTRIPEADKILTLLSRNKKKFFSVAGISRKAKVNRDNVSKRIWDLKNEGFDIETQGVYKKVYQLAS